MDYLVTTNKNRIPADRQIAMVDGTVPGWTAKSGDLHFDHHRVGGGLVQIDEIPWTVAELNADLYQPLFVTTQVDADAQVAAAWLQIGDRCGSEIIRKLRAIALDCDYLCIPPGEQEGYGDLAEFAAKAVAALKESGSQVVSFLGLPSDRQTWTPEQKEAYASECFKRGTEWLIDAAYGRRAWPGESGEADAYFERMERQEQAIRELGLVRLIDGCIYFDMRSIGQYIDPRVPLKIGIEMAKSQSGIELKPITLSARSAEIKALLLPVDAIPGYAYTIGSIPWIAGTDLASAGVFQRLEAEDQSKYAHLGIQKTDAWGGRAAVGGSGWNSPSLLNPQQVLKLAIEQHEAYQHSLMEADQEAVAKGL